MSREVSVSVKNIVSAVDFGVGINLRDLVSRVSGIEYNPECFPGAVYRLHEPRISALIFSSGKAVITGAQTEGEAYSAASKISSKLAEAGFNPCENPKVEIQNIVASANLNVRVNLDILAIESYNAEYAPEQFPGLVLRLEEPKITVLIFSTGKVIITGAKTIKDIRLASEKTMEAVRKHKAEME
jgi:transcription initiation factor TFIID TATA-box-binding protein